jgi:lysozyme
VKKKKTRRAGRIVAREQFEGIDVSRHQGPIDWAAVAAAGIRFAFIKATQGATLRDVRFTENWLRARQHGLLRGAYHFFSPNVAISQQVQNFVQTVDRVPGDLAPVIDLEVDNQDWDALPQPERLPAALEMIRQIEQHYGVKPIVYTNKRTIDEIFQSKPGGLTRHPLWVASYRLPPPRMPPGWPAWKFWQYTDAGAIAGIAGPVDRNRSDGAIGPTIPVPSLAGHRQRKRVKALPER